MNSPTQLAEILFDKLNLQPPARRGKGKVRSTAADILEEMADQHELPAQSDRISRNRQTEIHLCRCSAKADSSGDRPPAHQLFPNRHGNGPAQFQRPESAKHSRAQRAGPRNPRRVRGRKRQNPALRGLFSNRTAHHGAFFARPGAGASVSQRRGHSRPHGAGSLRCRPAGANRGAPPRRKSHQFRHHLRSFCLWPGTATGNRAEGSGPIHPRLFRPL